MNDKRNSTFTTLLCFLMVKGVYLDLNDLLTYDINHPKNHDLVKSTHFDTIET
ncbi:hypothetical protein AB3K25_08335 [Leuconostoc sp. MS02]|uniref:Transposase n=1 Tax=Leuconostoc aquikimchii TaxID=3236804 RepID=A0ABV3S0Y4_9LACO